MTDLRDQLQGTLGAAYTLERELGAGGMSRVFVGHERRVRILRPYLRVHSVGWISPATGPL
jgi:hypothetical protein